MLSFLLFSFWRLFFALRSLPPFCVVAVLCLHPTRTTQIVRDLLGSKSVPFPSLWPFVEPCVVAVVPPLSASRLVFKILVRIECWFLFLDFLLLSAWGPWLVRPFLRPAVWLIFSRSLTGSSYCYTSRNVWLSSCCLGLWSDRSIWLLAILFALEVLPPHWVLVYSIYRSFLLLLPVTFGCLLVAWVCGPFARSGCLQSFLHLNSYLLVGLSFGFTDSSYCYFP